MTEIEAIIKEIEVYKKNNKAFCDIAALYSYSLFRPKIINLTAYTGLDEVIKDLEDSDVNVPLKAESIEILLKQDSTKFNDLSELIRENGYESELGHQLHQDYRTIQTRMYYEKHGAINKPFDFIGYLCECEPDFISEILCSNIEMSKKVDILYDIIIHYIRHRYTMDLDNILNPKGAGYELARTHKDIKEQKISELISAFNKETEKKLNAKARKLYEEMKKNYCDEVEVRYVFKTLSYLHEKKLVDFLAFWGIAFGNEKLEVSPCAYICYELNVHKLEDFECFYQLDDYRNVDEKLRNNDSKYFLNNINLEDISSFIALSNYKIRSEHIEIIGKRVLDYQESKDEVSKDLIEEIKSAIIHKAKDEEERQKMCEYAQQFELIADYEAYKKASNEVVLKYPTRTGSLPEQTSE